MTKREDHIARVNYNLRTLGVLSKAAQQDSTDWQITIAFYSALHAVQAHLSGYPGIDINSHKDLDLIISPESSFSQFRLPIELHADYEELLNLSRKARYLCQKAESAPTLTGSFLKHSNLRKALFRLDRLLTHYQEQLSVQFERVKIFCSECSLDDKKKFNVLEVV
ncbi:hypothetical protein [Microcystis phage Mae-Yong924-2]|nr:hypothetical protein [Microcystis phage Mea-Yong924-1]QYC50713.1 hypothetical protein [Microcystis phage Mae-Yong924-2]